MQFQTKTIDDFIKVQSFTKQENAIKFAKSCSLWQQQKNEYKFKILPRMKKKPPLKI